MQVPRYVARPLPRQVLTSLYSQRGPFVPSSQSTPEGVPVGLSVVGGAVAGAEVEGAPEGDEVGLSVVGDAVVGAVVEGEIDGDEVLGLLVGDDVVGVAVGGADGEAVGDAVVGVSVAASWSC